MKKRPRDPNQLGKLIIDIATGQVEGRPPTPEEQGKDPAAVQRGRLGGLKGGKGEGEIYDARSAAKVSKEGYSGSLESSASSGFFLKLRPGSHSFRPQVPRPTLTISPTS
jgi:hypothetical protein